MPHAVEPTCFDVDRDGIRIAVTRWGDPDPRKPCVVLLHGTGFVARVWDEVANALAASHSVFALDRRGHGRSERPAPDRYHFRDFADDLRTVIEALDLHNIFGIGHSAGATDLLLCAALLPERFARIFAMEPTVMDPSLPAPANELSAERAAIVERVRRRRAQFASPAAAFERLRAAPAFARWSEAALRAYVEHGFDHAADGRVSLRCPPTIEAAMLIPIFQAMEQSYAGDRRGNPFGGLVDLCRPVRVSTAEGSAPIYKEMVRRAVRMIPGASALHFSGVGHNVAQEAPHLLLTALRAFDGEAEGIALAARDG